MGKDVGKIAGIAALGATGLGMAGIGPLAGVMGGGGASAAGLGAADALGAGLLGSPLAYGAAVPGVALGGEQAAMLAAQTGEFGAAGLGATMQAAAPTASTFGSALASPSNLASMGMNMMNQNQQPRPGMPVPPMPTQMPPQPTQASAALSPYRLPGGLSLHSMNTAQLFGGRPYG